MAERANYEGTIYKEKARDRWCAAITLESGERVYKKSKDKEVVRQWLTAAQAKIDKGRYIPPNKWTVTTWKDTWLKDYVNLSSIRTRTKEEYEKTINRNIKPFADLPLQGVTPDHVHRALLQLASEGKADSSILKAFRIISKMFKQAYLRRLIPFNPCDFVELPKGAGIVRPPRVGKKADVLKFLETAKNDVNPIAYPAVLLLFSAALRRSELLGLQWQDINFEEKTIKIKRSLQVIKGGLKVEDTKTNAGTREIAVGDDAITALKKLKNERNNPPFVFTSEGGTVYHPRNFSRIFARIEAKSGVSISLHGSRHSTATLLAEANISGTDLAGFLGHASASFTMARYVHPAREANTKVEQTISGILSQNG